MKILLISTNWETSPYPVYPIGMGMVAAALKKAGHQVEMFDFLQNDCSFDAIKKQVESVQPDVVGLSLRNITDMFTIVLG